MHAPPRSRSIEATQLSGARIISAMKDARVTYVLAVPDLHTSYGLLWPIAQDGDLRLIRVCKEDECIGIAAGLAYGNKRAVTLIQYTGFLYSMNAIRAMVQYCQPIVLMVGLLGKEPGIAPAQSKKFGVRIIEPIVDVMGIPRVLVEDDGDAPKVTRAIEDAYESSHPVAVLIGRRPA